MDTSIDRTHPTERTRPDPPISRRRLVQAGAGIAGGALALSGLHRAGWPLALAEATPQAGGQVSISLYGDADTFDPILATDNRSIWMMNLIYDTLLRLAATGTTLEPGLAERWDTSADGLTYTFHLRDARFHDGSPVTAADVAFSLDRVMNAPESQSSALYPPGTVFSTPDANTVVAQLTSTWGSFLNAIAYYAAAIIPKQTYEAAPATFFDHPIGSGPFQLESWDKEVQLHFDKHPAYWQTGRPYLDTATVLIQPDPAARATAFHEGTLDIFTDVPFEQLAALRTDAAVTMLIEPVASLLYLALNVARPPLDDPAVRQALSYAIDREAIIQTVMMGAATPATTYLPSLIPLHDDTVPGYPFDPEQATTLLAPTAGSGGLSLEMLAIEDDSALGRIATLIAGNLAKVGVTLVFPDVKTFGDRVQAGDYDLRFSQITGSEHDPDELTTYLIRSDLAENGSHYASTAFDQLAISAQTIAEPGARADAYQELQAIVMEDAPLIMLCSPEARTATTTAIQDFHILPDGSYRLWETWRSAN